MITEYLLPLALIVMFLSILRVAAVFPALWDVLTVRLLQTASASLAIPGTLLLQPANAS